MITRLKVQIVFGLLYAAVSFGGSLHAQPIAWEKVSEPVDGSLVALVSDSNLLMGTIRGYGVVVSTDSGGSWTNMMTSQFNGYAPQVASIAVSGSTIYAFAAPPHIDVYYRTTYDTMWRRGSMMGNGTSRPTSVTAAKDSALFIGSSLGILRSLDSGKTWRNSSTGVITDQDRGNIRAFTTMKSLLFAGSDMGGIYRTSTDGDSWETVNTGLGLMQILSFAKEGNLLFADAHSVGGGVFKSSDLGNSWQNVTTDVSEGIYISSLAATNGTVFAATDRIPASIYVTTDDGNSWTMAIAGLPQNSAVSSLTSAGDQVFAVTDSGLYRAYVAPSSEVLPSSAAQNSFSAAVYPEPALDLASLRISLPGSASVDARVFDLLGNSVLTAVHEVALDAGTHELPLNLSGLPSGTYYLRISTANNEVRMTKLIKQ